MVMKTFLGTIKCSDGFGKPENLEAQIVASGRFFDIGKEARTIIANGLNEAGLYTCRSQYSAGFQQNAGIYYADGKKDPMTEVHEKFHERFAKTKYHDEGNYDGVAYTYFKMFEESFAKALEYAWFVDNPGEHKVSDVEHTVNVFSRRGEAAYNLAMNITAIDKPRVYEKAVENFIGAQFTVHEDYNWLSFIMEVQYFGLFGPCFDIVWNYKNSAEIMQHALEMLIYDESGKDFIDYLNEVSDDERGMLGPLFEKEVQKSLYEFKNGEEKFQLMFFAPKEKDVNGELNFLRDIQENLRRKLEDNLLRIGEPGSRIWANYLKIRT